MKRVMLAVTIAISVSALCVGCSNGDSSEDEKKITVTKLGWIDNNIATDFWTTPLEGGATASFTFYIGYEGNISASDIDSASMSVGGVTWTLADGSHRNSIHSAAKNIGGGYYYDPDTPHSLPVGTATATISLVNGYSDTFSMALPIPGSLEVEGFTSMYDESYVGVPPATAAPMLKRASASSFTKGVSSISAQFAVDDDLAHNGDLWLYNASGEYIGVTRLFCNPATDLPDAAIVSSFSTNGMANSIGLESDEIEYEEGFTFSDIAAFRVVLFDGKQYEPVSSLRYDSRSVSSKYSF